MREYRLFLSTILKVLAIAIPAVFALFTIAIVVLAIVIRQWVFLALPAAWAIGITTYGWFIAKIPTIITTYDGGEIEFRSWRRTTRIVATDIIAVEPDTTQLGFLYVRHQRGKIRLLNQFTGFHRFLTWLEAQNPTATIIGCDPASSRVDSSANTSQETNRQVARA